MHYRRLLPTVDSYNFRVVFINPYSLYTLSPMLIVLVTHCHTVKIRHSRTQSANLIDCVDQVAFLPPPFWCVYWDFYPKQ